MLKTFALLVALFLPLLRGQCAVLINELMAAGQSVLAAEDGTYPDWLELHNPDESPIHLAGWHLTDDSAEPQKWTLPAVTIPAGGYLVVFVSGKDRAPAAGPLHTSFRLKSGGEFIGLTRPDGTLAASFDYPVQMPDVSFDGTNFLEQPTPGAANAAPLAIAITPDFSQPRGFQDAPFFLTLTSATPGAAIHYTLDGSEPSERSPRFSKALKIKRTTVVRAVALAGDAQASAVATRTFFFIDDIVQQSPHGETPKNFPKRWGLNRVDYGMDPRIIARSPTKKTIRDDLRTIPSLSIVMDTRDLFDRAEGIYANAQEKGRDWERPMSLERIEPSGGGGFQINAGLRIRGGASRDAGNPKHSFRVLCRSEYGAPELKFPLFGADGAQATSRFDIRCEQLVAWHYFVDENADFIRDIYGRDTQGALGQPYKRGDFHHLYINGQYWGLYQTDERISGEYAAEYFGDSEDDYDVVKYDAEASYGTGFIDGTFGSWRRLYDAGVAGFADNANYFKVQGSNTDGSRNKSYERLLDVDNLIDYMLAGIFIAADDSPPAFGTQNNWSALRSREDDFGFRFFAHDWEISMYNAGDNRVGEQPVDDPFGGEYPLGPESANPWHFWQAMRFNAEFRLRVADHVQRFFFNGGPLTVEAATERWRKRMDEIDRAVVGESARWGDARNEGVRPVQHARDVAAAWREGAGAAAGGAEPIVIDDPTPRPRPDPDVPLPKVKPFTREHWRAAADERVLQGYLPVRVPTVLQHLKDGGLYPSVSAPEIAPHGGPLAAGALVSMSVAEPFGAIFYTTDGSDPRRIGGAVAAEARQYAAPFSLAKPTTIKARALRDGQWSALVSVEFTPGIDLSGLRLTEIHYNPPAMGGATSDDGEFIELKNAGAAPLDLSGLRFPAGIEFTFPAGTTLAPGAFFVLARNPAVFSAQHPGVTANGIFTGKLSDDGETLALATAGGAPVLAVEYDDETPWPLAADGIGFSLVRLDAGDGDKGTSWRASAAAGGSPGSDDAEPAQHPSVVINEVLARPASGGEPTIELRNLENTAADISGWWLTDDQQAPRKFRIPAGTVLPPSGFIVFTATQFGATFTLSAVSGGAWLFSADETAALTGYVHGFGFDASREGKSFGRHVNSDEDEQFPAQASTTLGFANGGALAAPVRINEIHYFPPTGGAEFVELESHVDVSTPLAGARLAGLAFTFPTGAQISPRGLALVVTIDPQTFRSLHNVPAEVPIYGPAPGGLQDNGERLALEFPVAINGESGFIIAESVRYNDRKPWATGAAGFGASLQRIRATAYGDEPQHWLAGPPTPGAANTVNAPPAIVLTTPHDGTTVRPPQVVTFTADATDMDGTIAKVEFLVDNLVVGEDDAAPFEFIWRPTAGLHDLSARAIDDGGAATESDFVTVDVDAPENGAGSGLQGEYFSNADFTGGEFTRADPTIDFAWAEISPFGDRRKSYSVVWTGQLVPRKTGLHALFLNVAGGARLYVNGELILDQPDEPEGMTSRDAQVELVGGAVADLRLEYVERDGFGGITLLWSEPGEYEQLPIPQGQLFLPGQDPDVLGIVSATHLPARQINRAFRTQLQAVSGARPFAWHIVDGTLPSGVSFSGEGVLSGAAESAGTFHFRIRVTDSAGAFAEKEFALSVIDRTHPELRPSVTIIEPLSHTVLHGGKVVVRGSATAPRALAHLRYSLNGTEWRDFPAEAKWSLTLNELRGLLPGQNQVRVVAVDVDGRVSPEASRRFERVVRSPLSVAIEGAGTISGGFLGTTDRVLGRNYTIAATPAPGWIFAEWRELFSRDETLEFQMFEGLALTAVFVPNPFPALRGTYLGLIGEETAEHSTRGSIELTLTGKGAFTGKLRIGGVQHRLKERFAADGSTFFYFDGGGVFLSVTLQLRKEDGGIEAHVGISNGEQFIDVTGIARRSSFEESGDPCPLAGRFTLVLPGSEEGPPRGHGYGNMKIATDGRARVRGKLGDGTPWAAATWVRDDFSLPVYATLYEGAGAISGAINFPAAVGERGTGLLFWSKPAGSPPPYGDGFTAVVAAQASPYAPPSEGSPVLTLSSGRLLLHDGSADIRKTAELLPTHKFAVAPEAADQLKVRIDPGTGVITGSFVHPEFGLRELHGIADQLDNVVLGHFVGDASSGALEIRDEPPRANAP